MMTLVTGGARNGRGRHVGALIADSPNASYTVISQIFDEGVTTRVQHHRDERPTYWRTAECWQYLDELITTTNDPQEAILLGYITTTVANLLFALGGGNGPDSWGYAAIEQLVEGEIHSLIAAYQRRLAKIMLVTNEVEMGIMPENHLARHFRDIAGYVNQ